MKGKGVIRVSFPRGFFRVITPDRTRVGGFIAAHRIVLRVLAVIVFVLGKSTLSFAAPAPCAAGSLQSYIDLEQGGCTFDGLLFNNFDYTPSADNATEIPASDITVGFDFVANVGSGLMFSANWDVTNGELDGTITYDVTVLSKTQALTDEALIINGANLTCTCASPPGDGVVSATEDTLAANLATGVNREGGDEADFAAFLPRKGDSIDTEVSVMAGSFSSASVMSVSNLYSTIYSVPEPSTWAMMLIAFAGLGYAGWRRSAKMRLAPA
jgi:PEP-CTERM motif